MDANRLAELDAEGYTSLLAVAYDRAPRHGSFAYPHAFVCSDGRTYWVKRFQHGPFSAGDLAPGAQHGLVAELVAGRLGGGLGVAAVAEIVEVPTAALRRDGGTAHLEGVGVGSADQVGMENLRNLGDVMPGDRLEPGMLDESSVAGVIAFQSWIGADDTQAMIDLRSGRVLSVDHGALSAFSSRTPQVVVAPHLPEGFGSRRSALGPAIDRIEALTDEDLLRAVSQVPSGPEWRASLERRLGLAESLALRRDGLREAMAEWMT
jgi:hypothetical protein